MDENDKTNKPQKIIWRKRPNVENKKCLKNKIETNIPGNRENITFVKQLDAIRKGGMRRIMMTPIFMAEW